MEGPLSGIKVLDLTTFVAAPVCGRLLADMGAEVIKVEHPKGDAWRITGKNYSPARFSDQENPVFDIYNSGKKHICLNLKSEEGLAVFHQLLSQADVFITNTRPAALKRLGLSYEDLKEKYPSLVYGIVLGFGEKGPDAAKPAFDTSAFWSRSGFLRDMSADDGNYQPVLPPFGVGDTVTGYVLAMQICAALMRRSRTGLGDYVRSSLYHNGIFTMGTMTIVTQKPFGRSYPTSRLNFGMPGGSYMCADGEWIFIAVGYYDILVPLLCKAIGREDVLTDPRFETREKIAEHKEAYYAIFRDAFLQKPSQHWLDLAAELDIPVVRMNHFSEVNEDEQAWANDYLEHVEFPNGHVDVMPTSPIEMESMGVIKTKPAPVPGADTDDVLASLGYTAEQISAMRESGAIK